MWASKRARRSTRFTSPIDAERFPFDRQRLQLVLACAHDDPEQVVLDTSIEGWTSEQVTLRSDAEGGWHGESHARVYAELEIDRMASRTAPTIFIPLLALSTAAAIVLAAMA